MTSLKNNIDHYMQLKGIKMYSHRLKNLSEKELLIEIVFELKKIGKKCDDIARKIVIWSD